jgi:hypothetical protein
MQQSTNVNYQDIKLGEGITIHKIDTVLSFGAPFQLFTYRAGYLAMNAALEAADLNFAFGETGADFTGLNISDYTVFVPTDEAFKQIGSVLATADKETLRKVLSYHFIPNNVIFSPSLGNVTVPSLTGDDLTFTVLPDGSAWVNNARITFPNTILYNGVAHVIDSVLSPGKFDRANLKPNVPASERLAYPSASSVSSLPFSTISFEGDMMGYTSTPVLLKTMAAVPAQTSGASNVATSTASASMAMYTGAGSAMSPGAGSALAAAVGIAAYVL